MKQVVKIEKALLPVTGNSSNGAWVKQGFIASYGDRYPKEFCFELFNDKLEKFKNLCQEGSVVEVSFDIESREYNGRYYTNITAWNVAVPGQQTTTQQAPVSSGTAQPVAAPAEAPVAALVVAPAIGSADEPDDLPF